MNRLIAMLETVARVLSQVPQTIVFTGGATISLYLDEVSAADIRPTDDVDCVVEIMSRGQYYRLCDLLRTLGLTESMEPGAPICRWFLEDITIDVMPCDESVLGFANRWYVPGMSKAIAHQLPSGQEILIFSSPYLLASKIEAFMSRGGGNFYWSPDIEDIMALLDGREALEAEVQGADAEVKAFLSSWFRTSTEVLAELAPAFVSPVARRSGRARLLVQRIARLADL